MKIKMKAIAFLTAVMLIGILIVPAAYGQNWTPQYKIGDTGPGGGKIFYIADGKDGRPLGFTVYMSNPAENYTAYYLEAAPGNLAGTRQWCSCSGTCSVSDEVIASSSLGNNSLNFSDDQLNEIKKTIGYGRRSTEIIVNHHKGASAAGNAAIAADNYSTATADDWFLPSIGELYMLFLSKNRTDMTNNIFWSSSRSERNGASWYFNFVLGLRGFTTNSFKYSVRPIRAF